MNLKNLPGGNAPLHKGLVAALVLSATTLVSGCFTTAAQRDYARGDVPWWCEANGGGAALTEEECVRLSIQLDASANGALDYPTLGDALAAGATAVAITPGGIGHAVQLPGAPTFFKFGTPNVLLYNGNTNDSRIAGVAWNFASEPAGFDGTRDVWTYDSVSGTYWLTAWAIRGYHNHPDIFAANQPCLLAGVVPDPDNNLGSGEACFAAAHTEGLEVVVTNDDGYAADGIGALVDGLVLDSSITVHVVAPLHEQSGSGDSVTWAEHFNTFVDVGVTTTSGGYPATAVSSTEQDNVVTVNGNPHPTGDEDPYVSNRDGSGSPADSVIWALDEMNLSPDLILSGINSGQNFTRPFVNASGTVGAARTARKMGFPAIATSQHSNSGFDFPAGVTATLALLEEWRLGIRVVGLEEVPNLNTPTCTTGSIRGTVDVTVNPSYQSSTGALFCDSIVAEGSIVTDLDALYNGFIGISDVTTEDIP